MLKGRVALITGSARGIGKAISLCFAMAGADIVLNYTSDRSEREINALEEEIKQLGGRVISIRADVSQYDEAKKLINGVIKTFGKIDILVNNAGITKDMLLIRMTEKEFDDVLEVNLKGIFNCSKLGIQSMLKTGGSIINMSSVVGLTGNVGQSNYAASKAGIVGFTKAVAKEYASRNIRVNTIAPGAIQTEMLECIEERAKKEMMNHIPMKRYGTSEEVAKVALFLASDLSSYITGEVIRVDGGMAM